MTLNTRKNLAVQITPSGGANQLKLRLTMRLPVIIGVAVIGALSAGRTGTAPYAYSVADPSAFAAAGFTLNSSTGAIGGAGVSVGTFEFIGEVQDATATIFQGTFEINVLSPLSLTSQPPLPAEIGIPYAFQLEITGATGTVTFSGGSGSGISVSSAGLVNGTPSGSPTLLSLTVTATDGGSGQTLTFPVEFQIYDSPLLDFSAFPDLLTLFIGTKYEDIYLGLRPARSTLIQPLLPYRYAFDTATAAAIPWASINPNTGVISGVPDVRAAPFLLHLVITDSIGGVFLTSSIPVPSIQVINPSPSTDSGNALTIGADGALFVGGSSIGPSNIVGSPTGGPTFFDIFVVDASGYEDGTPVLLSDGLGNILYGHVDFVDVGTGELDVHAYTTGGVTGDPTLIPTGTLLSIVGAPGQNGNDGLGFLPVISGVSQDTSGHWILPFDTDVSVYDLGLWVYVSDGTNSLRAQVINNYSSFATLVVDGATATVTGDPTLLDGQIVVPANGLDGAVVSLYYREDSPYAGTAMTAASGDNTITLDQSEYASPISTLEVGKYVSAVANRFLGGTDYTRAGNILTLLTPFSGGENVYAKYWSTVSASATTLTTVTGGANRFDPTQIGGTISLSNADATATGPTGSGWVSVRGITSHATGKWYAECNDDADIVSYMVFGIGTSSASLTNYCGSDANGWGMHCNPNNPVNTYNSGTPTSGGTGQITTGGRGCIAVDVDAGNLWLGTTALSGTWCGGGDPATGTSPTYSFTPGTSIYLFLSIFGPSQVCTLKNFTSEATLTVPTGFSMFN